MRPLRLGPLRVGQRRALAVLLLLLAVAAGLAVPSVVRAASAPDPGPAASAPPEPFGASCRTTVRGSRVTAYCHNSYPESDLVRLHTDCELWWDVDADAAPVEVGPAQTVRLTDRCWKNVRAAWVTHQRAP